MRLILPFYHRMDTGLACHQLCYSACLLHSVRSFSRNCIENLEGVETGDTLATRK